MILDTGRRGGLTTTYVYFGVMVFLIDLASPRGYLADISTSFMLKDQLHMGPGPVAMFRALTALPAYVGFAFGLARDLWSPLGRHDRGYFLIFAPMTAAVFVALAFAPLSYFGLLAGMLAVGATFAFVGAAYAGLIALVAQERLMTGRLAVLWQCVATVPIVIAAAAGGWVARYLQPRDTFLILAGFNGLVFLLGFWKPRAVFEGVYDAMQARGSTFVGDVKRLVRHKAVYAPVLIWLLFSFSPGSTTPLQFYFSSRLHAPDSLFGLWTAVFAAAFLPPMLLYGWLCKRVRFGPLLFWSVLISVPQMIPMALIHTAAQSLWAAVVIGMLGGLIQAAIYDLAMRSCPPGLQGTLMTLLVAAYSLAVRLGDLVGVKIYALSPTYGFTYCVIAITVVYALMLPVLWLVPRHIMRSAEGEPDPEGEREALAELGQAPASA